MLIAEYTKVSYGFTSGSGSTRPPGSFFVSSMKRCELVVGAGAGGEAGEQRAGERGAENETCAIRFHVVTTRVASRRLPRFFAGFLAASAAASSSSSR